MKKIIVHTACYLLLLCCLSCAEKIPGGAAVNPAAIHSRLISSFTPVYPVLIGKEHNPVFRLRIDNRQGEMKQLQRLVISFKGTTALKDVAQLRVFHTTGQAFSDQHKLAETQPMEATLGLPVVFELNRDTQYLWLALTLSDRAPLTNKVSARIEHLTIDDQLMVFGGDANPQPNRIGHALRQHGDDGVHTYRIPGLATTNEGTLIAVYDIRHDGSVDLQADVNVGMNRSTDGGQSWEPMKVIMDMEEWGGLPEDQNGIGDPSILVDRRSNTIWVAGVWAHGHPNERLWWASRPGLEPEQTGQLMLTKSEDDGKSWSEPINITKQIKKPGWNLVLQGPGKGITMEDGTLVFPAQFKDEQDMPHATIIYSKDGGKTWKAGTSAKSNTTEAQVVELSDHSLMLNMRDNRGSGAGKGTGTRSVAISRDLGASWTEHPSSGHALPEPVCMASLIKHRYKGKDLLIFSNPADQHQRRSLTLKVSEDQGLHWPQHFFTLIDEGQSRGYSCLTPIDQNTLGMLYEGSQADLVFQIIQLKEVFAH